MRCFGKGLGCLVLLALFVSASAASAKMYDRHKHRDWDSLILTSNNDAVARIATEELEPKFSERLAMVLDFPPQQCGVGQLKLIACYPGGRRLPPQQGRAQIRVDSMDVMDADINIFMNRDRCVTVSVSNYDNSALLRDAMRGTEIRFKLQVGQTTLYRKFSLLGFTDAYARSRELCQIVADELRPRRGEDERYFEPGTPRRNTPGTPRPDTSRPDARNAPGTPNPPENPGEVTHF